MRLGGLYALERLAQDNPGQRKTIVNVVCAYLRMPYTLPDGLPEDQVNTVEITAQHQERLQEREVRLTAQRLLTMHLRPVDAAYPVDTFWADVDLDLTGAVLINLDLRFCCLRKATFTEAKPAGIAAVAGAKFTGDVRFDRTEFTGDTWFHGTEFIGDARFRGAKFASGVWFDKAKFDRLAMFDGATFAGEVRFNGTEFTGNATFGGTAFSEASVQGKSRSQKLVSRVRC